MALGVSLILSLQDCRHLLKLLLVLLLFRGKITKGELLFQVFVAAFTSVVNFELLCIFDRTLLQRTVTFLFSGRF